MEAVVTLTKKFACIPKRDKVAMIMKMLRQNERVCSVKMTRVKNPVQSATWPQTATMSKYEWSRRSISPRMGSFSREEAAWVLVVTSATGRASGQPGPFLRLWVWINSSSSRWTAKGPASAFLVISLCRHSTSNSREWVKVPMKARSKKVATSKTNSNDHMHMLWTWMNSNISEIQARLRHGDIKRRKWGPELSISLTHRGKGGYKWYNFTNYVVCIYSE